jgi:methylamine dehydrogenase accessory protein MauD
MNGIWLISYISLWILVVVLTIIVLGLVRQLGIIYLRLGPEQNLLATTEGLELGKPLPEFEANEFTHNRIFTAKDLEGRQSILVFVSPSCSPCKELMPHLIEFQKSWDGKINIVLFCQGEARPGIEFFSSYDLHSYLIIDQEGKLSETFHVRATPYAYSLDKDGIVQKRGIVNNRSGLEELLDKFSPSQETVDLPSSTN